MQFSDEDVDALLREDIHSTGIIRKVSVKRVYSPLLDLLSQYGYRETNDPKDTAGTMYAWHYDWRQDLRIAAEKLANFLDAIQHAREGKLEFTLIAHSMGGLIARTYLESRDFQNHAARPIVRRLFTLGTPHRGAPVALAHITGKLGKLWLSAEQVKRLANDARYPSVYQLLPPDDEPYLWNRGGTHEVVKLNQDWPVRLGLTNQSLQAMREWRSYLDLDLLLNTVRVFAFLGMTHGTATSVWLSNNASGSTLDVRETPGSGDATVPESSATLPGMQHYEVEGEHGTIFQDDMVAAILPRLLGKASLLAVSGTGAVRLSLAQPIVPMAGRIRGAIVLRHAAARAKQLRGTLQVLPDRKWDWASAMPAALPSQAFQVDGIQSERLAFDLDPPAQPGAYSVLLNIEFDGNHVGLQEPLGVRRDL